MNPNDLSPTFGDDFKVAVDRLQSLTLQFRVDAGSRQNVGNVECALDVEHALDKLEARVATVCRLRA